MLEKAIEKVLASNSDFVGAIIKKFFKINIIEEGGVVTFTTYYGNTVICKETINIKAIVEKINAK